MLRVRVGIVFFLKIVFDRDVDAPGFPFLGIFFLPPWNRISGWVIYEEAKSKEKGLRETDR